jgi:hypothetical protein
MDVSQFGLFDLGAFARRPRDSGSKVPVGTIGARPTGDIQARTSRVPASRVPASGVAGSRLGVPDRADGPLPRRLDGAEPA